MPSTPDLCDAFPDVVRVGEPLLKNFGGRRFFGGEIVTVQCFEDNSRVKELVNTPGQGKVIVVDGGGSLRCALLGDLLAAKALENGWAGLLVNACIRDVEIIETLDIGVQALAAVPLKSVRKGLGKVGLSVTFAGLTFCSGDYAYADDNGIIVSGKKLLAS